MGLQAPIQIGIIVNIMMDCEDQENDLLLEGLQMTHTLDGAELLDQDVIQELFCQECGEIFVDPIRLSCGCTFCEGCVVVYQNDDKTVVSTWQKCPNQECNQTLRHDQFRKNFAIFNLINDLQVYCQNEKCSFQGAFSEYKKHRVQCMPEYFGEDRDEQDEILKALTEKIKKESREDVAIGKENYAREQEVLREKEIKRKKERDYVKAIMNCPEGGLTIGELEKRYLVREDDKQGEVEKEREMVEEQNERLREANLVSDVQKLPLFTKHLAEFEPALKKYLEQRFQTAHRQHENSVLMQDDEQYDQNSKIQDLTLTPFTKAFISHFLKQGYERVQAGVKPQPIRSVNPPVYSKYMQLRKQNKKRRIDEKLPINLEELEEQNKNYQSKVTRKRRGETGEGVQSKKPSQLIAIDESEEEK